MKDVQDLHRVFVQPVRHNVRRSGNNKLEGAGGAAFSAEVREIDQLGNLPVDVVINAKRSKHIALCDVVD